MRKWLFAWLFVASSFTTALAGGPISFSPPLPAPWIVKIEKDLPEKNPTGHVVVIVNTNEHFSMTISLTKPSKADAGKDFEQRVQDCGALASSTALAEMTNSPN